MFTLPPVRSILISVSVYVFVYLSVCLFAITCPCARISRRSHVQISPNFLHMLPVAVARSSTACIAIRHVLPVLWMTSCFRIMSESETTSMFRPVRQVVHQSDDRQRCFVDIARWRHLGEVCRLRLHLVVIV